MVTKGAELHRDAFTLTAGKKACFKDGSEFFGPWDDSLRRPTDTCQFPPYAGIDGEGPLGLPESWLRRDKAYMPAVAHHLGRASRTSSPAR